MTFPHEIKEMMRSFLPRSIPVHPGIERLSCELSQPVYTPAHEMLSGKRGESILVTRIAQESPLVAPEPAGVSTDMYRSSANLVKKTSPLRESPRRGLHLPMLSPDHLLSGQHFGQGSTSPVMGQT